MRESASGCAVGTAMAETGRRAVERAAGRGQ